MTPFARSAALSVAVGLMAGPALADFTATELWTEWQRLAADQDQALSVQSQAARKDGLDLSKLVLVETTDGTTVTTTLDTVRLTNTATGVRVVVPGGQTLTVDTLAADATETTAVFALTAGDLTLLASGDLTTPNYDLSARNFSVNLQRLEENGTTVPGKFVLGVSDLQGTLTHQTPAPNGTPDADAQTPIRTELTASAMTLAVDATDPTSGQRASMTSALSKVAADVTMLPGSDSAARQPTLSARITSSAAQSSLSQTGGHAGTFQALTSQGPGHLTIDIADDRAAYDLAATKLTATLSSDRMPAGPLALSMAAAKLGLSLPTSASSPSATARLSAKLTDIALDEQVWSLLDPSQALPRDPGQVALELEADLALPADPTQPVETYPDALRLNDLSVRFAETDLNANGAFTFPNGPAYGMAGLVQPVGSLDLVLTGGITLLQRLTEAGLVTAQQALGAQMMLSMFAVPGDGDSLTSTIVTEPDGGMSINGTTVR
ncbi:DUF2125 domain-containing protein [Pseudoruegeria sp. SK021]|uniref:DUF2125 domain-containing protein n=1 Tax=Pseudoruegeria sp. SK021 TaxID=1933035 RepID=UPI000A264A77|nr:DUF2125 domain-containing protein [Pseudoruegeria sp. SK021]OSP55067.1 hypothetical protein BV911_09610 [Pseudoruegeria sp. SK021]